MFEKRTIYIAGRAIPGVQVSKGETESVELPSGKSIPAQFADIVSLRETNPDGENPGQVYLTLTRENLRFATLRFDHVVGLDVSEDGTILTPADLEALRGEDIQARQVARMAAMAPTGDALDF